MGARAYESQVQQDIFTADCTATTTNTGSGVTTAYGCPEPPTVESYLRIMAGERVVFEGWYDVRNMKSLRVKFIGVHNYEYIYKRDAELTLVGDRWELRLEELPVGTYTMTIYMLATNGETVATSHQVVVYDSSQAETDQTAAMGSAGGLSGGGGESQRRKVELITSGNAQDSAATTSQGDKTHTVADGRMSTLEYLRQIIVSYVSPSFVLAFVASLLVCGYIFYLLGRHYRRLDQQHRQEVDALRRASHTLHRPRRRLATHHIIHRQRRRHT